MKPIFKHCNSLEILLAAFLLATGLLFASCQRGPRLTLEENDDFISAKIGSRTILTYNKSLQQSPEGMDPVYARSGYIHPVFTPSGQIATGDFSVDHAHQHGLFMAWTNTNFKGKFVDFWNQRLKLGRVEHSKVVETKQSQDSVSFTVAHSHIATLEESETLVLNETWKVTVRATPDDYYLFDIESNQNLASKFPLTLNEYRYGGMALRGSNEWTETEDNPTGTCEFLTSNGHARIEGNHTKTRWVTMSGTVEGNPASISVLNHPDNFRSPQTVRIHNKMPYFTFAPMVEGEFSIKPGETYTSRYRYLVTSQKPDANWIDAQWQEYVNANR